MTTEFEIWLREARRYSKHIWCYEDLVDDHPEASVSAFIQDKDVYDYVEELGEKYGLQRADQDWGIHTGVRFQRG